MEPVITSEVVVAYSQCPRKAYLLMFSPDKGEPHEYVKILEQERRENQERYIDRLKQKYTDIQPYDAQNLRKGSEILINAHLQGDGFEAKCTVLTRVEGKSALGKHSYEPTICVGTHTISKEQKLEIAFVGYVLERLQNKSPVAGKIIGMNGSSHTVKLENSSKDLLPILEPIQEWTTVDSPEPPPIVLNKHCALCPFQQPCQAQAEQEDNLSLLGGIKPKEILKLNSKGIFTINQLSYTFRPRRIRNRPTNYTRPHSFELQALAIKSQKTYVHELPKLPKSNVEIYFDLEGIPDLNFQYLIGLVIKDRNNIDHYFFWADSKDKGITIFQKFIALLSRYSEFILFHYGSYEYKYLQKMSKYIESGEQKHIEKILQSCCNILSFLYSNIYFPTYTNGLKDVASLIGFRWTDENASGLQSIIWRKKWEETQDEEMKNKLILYNKEDCYALHEVKNLIYSIVENENKINNQSNIYETVYPENLKRNSIFSFRDSALRAGF
jgi:predicted RecB family nuclease